MVAALTISGPGFNPFGRVWSAYERSLHRRPVLTQAASSALLWGVGDAMAQRIETRGRGGVDSRRVALTAGFGGALIGPAGHGWYLMLERLVLQLGLACSTKSMLLKVAVDNLLYSPCYVLAFFAFGCMAIDGLSPPAFVARMREDFLPTMLAEAMLWPPYMCAVFSRVPVKHQLLAVNVATLFDVCFLSWVRNKNADTALPQAQQQPQAKESQTIAEPQQRAAKSQARGAAAKPPAARKAATALEGESKRAQETAQPRRDAADEFDGVVSRDAAAALWPWVAVPSEENLGRMALMAASATCSSSAAGGGGGFFFGMRPAVTPAVAGADACTAAAAPGPR